MLITEMKIYRKAAKRRKGEWRIDEIQRCSAFLCALCAEVRQLLTFPHLPHLAVQAAGRMPTPRGPGILPDTGSLARLDRKTGVPPVREDSASRLSAAATTGWKPVVPDRRDACPPAKPTVLGSLPAPQGKSGLGMLPGFTGSGQHARATDHGV